MSNPVAPWAFGAPGSRIHADLELTDLKSGSKFVGELEHLTEEFVQIDPQQPPAWLERQVLLSTDAADASDSEVAE